MTTAKRKQRQRELFKQRYNQRKHHPELFTCLCGNRAAAMHCGDMVCSRCLALEAEMNYMSITTVFCGIAETIASATSRSRNEFMIDPCDEYRPVMGASLKYLDNLLANAANQD